MSRQQAATRASVLKPATTELGKRIDAHCAAWGLSLVELAGILGVDRSYLNHARRGTKPRLTGAKIAAALDRLEHAPLRQEGGEG